MMTITVCPLSRLPDMLAATGAGDVVTLMTSGSPKPTTVGVARHLCLELSDITERTQGHILAAHGHIARLIHFARSWDRAKPLLIHCYAGVSRSPAAAFAVACALRPDWDERALAVRIRASSPTATPNSKIVALADAVLARSGRMIEAAAAIGRGAECFEGVPFSLEIG